MLCMSHDTMTKSAPLQNNVIGKRTGIKVTPNSITDLPPLLEKVIGERDSPLAGTALKGESGDPPSL